MVSGVSWFNGHESSATGRADFSSRFESGFDGRAISRRMRHIHDLRNETNHAIRRRRPFQLNRIVRRHGARGLIRA